MMRYKLFAATGEDDILIYEDDDFLKIAHKMLSCDEFSEYWIEYHSEFINEVDYVYYPKKQMVIKKGYSVDTTMHVDAFIAYLETLDGGEG